MKFESTDILQQLWQEYPFSEHLLQRLVCGDKYVAVVLTNGNIGVCATLGTEVVPDKSMLSAPNFGSISHRILVCAWINACANYTLPASSGDIFDAIAFARFSRIAMVGYFGSLVKKFTDAGLAVDVFDLDESEKPVLPLAKQQEYLAAADALIVTSTTIFNGTLGALLAMVRPVCAVYMLGPSTPLCSAMLDIPNVKALFGSRFKPSDERVLTQIAIGGGTRSFLGFLDKVYVE